MAPELHCSLSPWPIAQTAICVSINLCYAGTSESPAMQLFQVDICMFFLQLQEREKTFFFNRKTADWCKRQWRCSIHAVWPCRHHAIQMRQRIKCRFDRQPIPVSDAGNCLVRIHFLWNGCIVFSEYVMCQLEEHSIQGKERGEHHKLTCSRSWYVMDHRNDFACLFGSHGLQ